MYWLKVKKHLQFQERVSQWWAPGQQGSIFAYNNTEKRLIRSIRQYGGAQISRGEAIVREYERGEDKRGLGRWVWQLYRGANNKRLRVITAYRPNPSNRPFTVYSQHKALFNEIDKRNWEPRKQMLNDLQKTINKWRRNQEQVILMMDCNEDVRSLRMRKFLDDVGMKEAIHDWHGSNAPATYIEGQLPIDGLFATSAMTIRAGGYVSFDQGIQGQ